MCSRFYFPKAGIAIASTNTFSLSNPSTLPSCHSLCSVTTTHQCVTHREYYVTSESASYKGTEVLPGSSSYRDCVHLTCLLPHYTFAIRTQLPGYEEAFVQRTLVSRLIGKPLLGFTWQLALTAGQVREEGFIQFFQSFTICHKGIQSRITIAITDSCH